MCLELMLHAVPPQLAPALMRVHRERVTSTQSRKLTWLIVLIVLHRKSQAGAWHLRCPNTSLLTEVDVENIHHKTTQPQFEAHRKFKVAIDLRKIHVETRSPHSYGAKCFCLIHGNRSLATYSLAQTPSVRRFMLFRFPFSAYQQRSQVVALATPPRLLLPLPGMKSCSERPCRPKRPEYRVSSHSPVQPS